MPKQGDQRYRRAQSPAWAQAKNVAGSRHCTGVLREAGRTDVPTRPSTPRTATGLTLDVGHLLLQQIRADAEWAGRFTGADRRALSPRCSRACSEFGSWCGRQAAEPDDGAA
jgi:hypothetical protein